MTLLRAGQAGTTTSKPDDDVLPEVPAEIPRHQGDGRPKVRVADNPGKFFYARRASSYAKNVESTWVLDQWKLRAVTYGLSRNPALVTRGQAVRAFENRDDPVAHKKIKDELQAIASDAMDTARVNDRAMRGTALHTLSEAKDRGDDLSYLDPVTAAALSAWRRMLARFEIVGTEQFVINDEYELGGSYDRLVRPLGVMRAPAGAPDAGEVRLTPDDVVILDLKTGRDSKYFGPCYAGQQAGYAGGVPYVHVDDAAMVAGRDGTGAVRDNGRREWPGGRAPHQRWALIPHIPAESPQDAGLMWVDLAAGRWCLDLARRIYAARKATESMFGEAELPDVGDGALAAELAAEQAPRNAIEKKLDELLGLLQSAPNIDAVNVLHTGWNSVWTDECTQVVKDRIKSGELKTGAAA